MLSVDRHPDGYLVCRAEGRLRREDYDAAVPRIEEELDRAEGALDVLIQLDDCDGWELGALWRDLRFDARRANEFRRVAVVAEPSLEEYGAKFSEPFTAVETKFFEPADDDAARSWLKRSRRES